MTEVMVVNAIYVNMDTKNKRITKIQQSIGGALKVYHAIQEIVFDIKGRDNGHTKNISGNLGRTERR